MIDTKAQLEGTLDQITWASDALEGLRRSVDEQSVRVFPVIAEAYISHIRAMTAEARSYLEGLNQEVSADYHPPAMDARGKAA